MSLSDQTVEPITTLDEKEALAQGKVYWLTYLLNYQLNLWIIKIRFDLLPFQQFDKNSSISGNVSVQSNSHSGTFDSSNIINNNDDGLDNGTITQSHWWRCSHSHHHQNFTDTHTKDHIAQIHSDWLHILKCPLEKYVEVSHTTCWKKGWQQWWVNHNKKCQRFNELLCDLFLRRLVVNQLVSKQNQSVSHSLSWIAKFTEGQMKFAWKCFITLHVHSKWLQPLIERCTTHLRSPVSLMTLKRRTMCQLVCFIALSHTDLMWLQRELAWAPG